MKQNLIFGNAIEEEEEEETIKKKKMDKKKLKRYKKNNKRMVKKVLQMTFILDWPSVVSKHLPLVASPLLILLSLRDSPT